MDKTNDIRKRLSWLLYKELNINYHDMENKITVDSKINTENTFILDLIFNMYDDKFRSNVYNKIEYYTNFSKNIYSGVQFYAQHLDQNIAQLEDIINKYYNTEYRHFIMGYIVELGLHNNYANILDNKYLVITNNYSVYNMSNKSITTVKRKGSINLADILLNGIICSDTLKKYTKDEIMALFLIYLESNKFINNDDIPPLLILCSKKIANIIDNTYYDCRIPETKIKSALQKWLILLKSLSVIPEDCLNLCKRYMRISIQTVFFKEKSEQIYGRITKTLYYKNYTYKIDFPDIDKLIKEIYMIDTINEWINYIEKIQELSEVSIMLIFNIIDNNFSEVLLGSFNSLMSHKTLKLKISSEEVYQYINKKLYLKEGKHFDRDGNCIYELKIEYNRNLEKCKETTLYHIHTIDQLKF